MLLIIDNYDSFTYNLVQRVGEIDLLADQTREIRVLRNDDVTVEEAEKLAPTHLLISPGPCTPDKSGVSRELIEAFRGKIPILGVCLGHQAIGQAFGGKIIKNKPMHGKVSNIYHYKSDIFKNLTNPFKATRYHSLSIERKSLPNCLKVTAELKKNGMIMGIKHKKLSIYGVQFHPESIASQHGHDLIKNFLELSKNK